MIYTVQPLCTLIHKVVPATPLVVYLYFYFPGYATMNSLGTLRASLSSNLSEVVW
jgi:hypothetical protein